MRSTSRRCASGCTSISTSAGCRIRSRSAAFASHRGAAGDDPLARPAHVRWSPQQSDPEPRTPAAPSEPTLRRAFPAGPAANDASLGDPDAMDTDSATRAGRRSVARAASAVAQRAQAERARLATARGGAALRAPVRARRRAPAARPPTSSLASRSEAREQAEALTRALSTRWSASRTCASACSPRRAGDKASMHAINVAHHLAADGPLLRLRRRGDAGPRRRRDAARRRQDRDAGAPAPSRGDLLAQRAARLRGARRDGPRAGAPHGPDGRRDRGDRASTTSTPTAAASRPSSTATG